MSDATLPTVLLVDDEPNILRAIQRVLRHDGYEVLTAESGEAALELLKQHEVSLILTDQRMPGMTGGELLGHAYRLKPDVYRITLTGYADVESVQKSINEGRVHQFLTKPWDSEHLRQVVRNGIESTQLVRENRRLADLTKKQNEQLRRFNMELEQEVELRTKALRAQIVKLNGFQRAQRETLRDVVDMLGSVLALVSPSLSIHCKRVGDFARRLALTACLLEDKAHEIEIAAYLHDIGKIAEFASRPKRGGPVAKPAPFYQVGHELLSQIGGFKDIALDVSHQCEHYNGTGKPHSLTGERIPIGARVIAIANAYDETVHTDFRPTEPDRAAGLKTLKNERYKKFDPELVDYALIVIAREAEEAKETEVEVSPKNLKAGMILTRNVLNAGGLLLLKKDTALTDQMIDQLRGISHGDIMLGSVFVRCEKKDEPADGKPDAAGDSLDAPRESAA